MLRIATSRYRRWWLAQVLGAILALAMSNPPVASSAEPTPPKNPVVKEAEALVGAFKPRLEKFSPPQDGMIRLAVLNVRAAEGPPPYPLLEASRALSGELVEAFRRETARAMTRRDKAPADATPESLNRGEFIAFGVTDEAELGDRLARTGRNPTEIRPDRAKELGRLLEPLGLDVAILGTWDISTEAWADPALTPEQARDEKLAIKFTLVDRQGRTESIDRPLSPRVVTLPGEAAPSSHASPRQLFSVGLSLRGAMPPHELTPITLREVELEQKKNYPMYRNVLFCAVPDLKEWHGANFVITLTRREGDPIGYVNPIPEAEALRLFGAAVLVDGIDSFALPDSKSSTGKPVYKFRDYRQAGMWILGPPGYVVGGKPQGSPDPAFAPGQSYALRKVAEGGKDHALVEIPGFQTQATKAALFSFAPRPLSESYIQNPGKIQPERGAVQVYLFAQQLEGDKTHALGMTGVHPGDEIHHPIEPIQIKRHDTPVDSWIIFFHEPNKGPLREEVLVPVVLPR